MTIEQIKAEAKRRFDMDVTDEEAQALLEQHGGELSDEELDDVNGGFGFILKIGKKPAAKPWPSSGKKKPQAGTLVYHPADPPVATTLEHCGKTGGKIELL